MTPTPEQAAILTAATRTTDNLSINALAGTGKSATLRMIERAVRTKPILYLAFNKAIVKEIKYDPRASADDAAKRMTSTTTVKTFNSIGHTIWARTTGTNLTLDTDKCRKLLRAVIDQLPKGAARDEVWEAFWTVIDGVALAKALGYVPEGKFPTATRLCTQGTFHASLDETPDDLTADLIDLVLFHSIQQAHKGTIDFNDQVYMPAIFGGQFPQYPLTLVDEAQDLNPVNHALLGRLIRGRTIIVGDPQQSIYGFRGAVEAGMEALGTRFSTASFPLSVSFRCPQAIVEAARWRVPTYQWSKPGGHYEVLDTLSGPAIPTDAVILCRNNAPLIACAFHLLSTGRSVSVAGADIGPKLTALLRKLGPESLTREQTLGAIGDWEAAKLDKGSLAARDLAACMRVFASHGSDLGQAIRYAEHIFAQKGTIQLLTGHKAKGREFPLVYHLDPWLCSEADQDRNLRYVIQTRSSDTYFEIDSARIKW